MSIDFEEEPTEEEVKRLKKFLVQEELREDWVKALRYDKILNVMKETLSVEVNLVDEIWEFAKTQADKIQDLFQDDF